MDSFIERIKWLVKRYFLGVYYALTLQFDKMVELAANEDLEKKQ